MKAIHILIFSLVFSNLFSQEIKEKEIKTEVNEVTVFIDGAQVVRQKKVDLLQGTTLLKFTGLSPFIDPKSVQVKAQGELTVLSVNHQQNFMKQLEKSAELKELEKDLKALEEKIQLENTHLSVIREELEFLKANRDLGGRNEQISVVNLQQASEFYGKKMTELKLQEIERTRNLEVLNRKREEVQNQIRTLSSKEEYPSGEVYVKASAEKAGSFNFELNYVVGNAGWFPSYDIRVETIEQPVKLVYKANVRQDTKADWKNVKLSFSSSDPNVSGIAPQLQPYYLDYNTRPPVYRQPVNNVSGMVMDPQGAPLAGVSVQVEGTTLGTITDISGNYSLTVPDRAAMLRFSYIGYATKILPITGPVMNIVLEEEAAQLEEVVIAYGSRKKSMNQALQGRAAGISVEDEMENAGSLSIPVNRVEKQTTIDFEINTPWTILSDNKNYTVDMTSYELPAAYQYYSVPGINKEAYLIAGIIDWEQYSLLEGEANIFFEGTFVGKSLLDVRFASDTLDISLGRDRQIQVEREKVRDFTKKQFIGNKKEETIAWKTSVKNNKSQEISMILLDQVPVSTREEIEVSIENMSGAKHNVETGEIRWEFSLAPGESKELTLRYTVKYPKGKTLILE